MRELSDLGLEIAPQTSEQGFGYDALPSVGAPGFPGVASNAGDAINIYGTTEVVGLPDEKRVGIQESVNVVVSRSATIVCPACNVAYVTQKDLDIHMKKRHKN